MKLKCNKIFGYGLFIPAVLLSIFGCEKPKEIDFSDKEKLESHPPESHENSLKVIVGSMVTPPTGFAYYQQLFDYLGKQLNRPVEFVAEESYEGGLNLLKNSLVDAGFVCGSPYVEGHKTFGLQLLVVPQIDGKVLYSSYLIVHKDSPITSLEELRGKVFAFADPMSNSGKLVPTYLLARLNETPESFFEKYIYTYGHDNTIKAVAQRIVDGAMVNSLIYEYDVKFAPEYTSRTKVVFRSDPHGIPPVVVPADFDPELKKRLQEIFLKMHNDQEGLKILQGMGIDKFVEADDSAYNFIRAMKEYLQEKNFP